MILTASLALAAPLHTGNRRDTSVSTTHPDTLRSLNRREALHPGNRRSALHTGSRRSALRDPYFRFADADDDADDVGSQ